MVNVGIVGNAIWGGLDDIGDVTEVAGGVVEATAELLGDTAAELGSSTRVLCNSML